MASTERLWLTDPRRSTCLATVTEVRGDHFALDRSLFAPTSKVHRHPQPRDTGTVWVGNAEKRTLTGSFFDGGQLWHRLRGTVPSRGTRLNCQLDQDQRLRTSRTHTAMHLFLAAMRHGAGPALATDPTVKGGGTFRLDLATHSVAPKSLAAWLAEANGAVAANHRVTVEHVPRELQAKVLDVQAFDPPDPYPGPSDVVTAVRIEGACVYPCDGTHVEQTVKVGRLVLSMARPAGATFTVIGKVV